MDKKLKLYAKLFKKLKAIEAALEKLKPAAIEELSAKPNQKALISKIKFSLAQTPSRAQYTKEFDEQIKSLKEQEKLNNRVTFSESHTTIRGEIAEAVREEVFASVPEYRKVV